MSSLKSGLAAALAAALLSLSLTPGAQAHRGDTGPKWSYSRPAPSNPSATRGTKTWPESNPDNHGAGVG